LKLSPIMYYVTSTYVTKNVKSKYDYAL